MTGPTGTTGGGSNDRDRLANAKDRAVDAASSAADTLRNKAQDTVSDVRDEAQDRAEQGIENAASGLQSTAHRLRDVAGDLDEKDRWLGSTLERAAGSVEKAGDYLSGQNLGDVVNDAQRVARESPAAFMGGAAALGFALARIGKVTLDRASKSSGDGARRSVMLDNGTRVALAPEPNDSGSRT